MKTFCALAVVCLFGCASRDDGYQHYLDEQNVHISSALEWNIQNNPDLYQTNIVVTNKVWRVRGEHYD